MKKTLKYWLPLAVTITLLCGLFYAVAQQNYRQTANDPQIQVAEDVGKILEGGEDPTALNQQGQTDLKTSLSMFILVYDKDGKAVAGNGMLDDKLPDFPKSALDQAKDKQYHVTWQPTKGLRFAAVVQSYGGQTPGYVVTARSLRVVEDRIKQTTIIVAIGWAITLLVSLLVTILLFNFEAIKQRLRRKKAAPQTEQPPLTEPPKHDKIA